MKGLLIRSLTLVLLFAFLMAAALQLNPFGSPSHTVMDDYYIRNGQAETASNNIVSSVVFDYRGMDTLIEGSVLFTAATGVLLVLYRRKENERKG